MTLKASFTSGYNSIIFQCRESCLINGIPLEITLRESFSCSLFFVFFGEMWASKLLMTFSSGWLTYRTENLFVHSKPIKLALNWLTVLALKTDFVAITLALMVWLRNLNFPLLAPLRLSAGVLVEIEVWCLSALCIAFDLKTEWRWSLNKKQMLKTSKN